MKQDEVWMCCQHSLTSCGREKKRRWSSCCHTPRRTCCHTGGYGRPRCLSNGRMSSATAPERAAPPCKEKDQLTWEENQRTTTGHLEVLEETSGDLMQRWRTRLQKLLWLHLLPQVWLKIDLRNIVPLKRKQAMCCGLTVVNVFDYSIGWWFYPKCKEQVQLSRPQANGWIKNKQHQPDV